MSPDFSDKKKGVTSVALIASSIETVPTCGALPCDCSVFLPGDNEADAQSRCSLRVQGQQVPDSRAGDPV